MCVMRRDDRRCQQQDRRIAADLLLAPSTVEILRHSDAFHHFVSLLMSEHSEATDEQSVRRAG